MEDSSFQLSYKSCQRWTTLVGCFTFWSTLSHTSSMGFKSADCTSQDISWRTCCSFLLFMYFWQSLLVCFGSLCCMNTNPWPTSHIPGGITFDSWSDSICPIPGANLWLWNWQKRASFMLCSWCDTGGCSYFTNALQHIDPSIWLKDFKLWFIVQRTLLHCSIIQSLCALAYWSLLTLFCFLNNGFLTAILAYKPASQSSIHNGCWHIFSMTLLQTSLHNWTSQPSVMQAGDWWNCPLHR